MKWVYPLFIIFAVVILGGSFYLIFAQPKVIVQSPQEKALTGIIPVKEIEQGVIKVNELYNTYGEVSINRADFFLTFLGYFKKGSARAVTITSGGKDLNLESLSRDIIYQTSKSINSTDFNKVTFDSFKPGDKVDVVAVVDLKTGKITASFVKKYVQ